LNLRSRNGKTDHTSKGVVTVCLSINEPTQAGMIALSNAREDIERGGIAKAAAAGSGAARVMDTAMGAVQVSEDLQTRLWSVVSKLDVFVQIIEKTSTVSMQKPYA
jgi:hypothetical protein